MINKLLDYGIKKETIAKIKETIFLEYSFEINFDNCVKTIEYLKSIKILNIDDLLLSVPDLFFKTTKDVIELFNKKDVSELVNLINEDYSNIDLLFEESM